jgi:hypothetical protein
MKMDDSQEMALNGEKEVLNLSEHYSKFNRTQEFLSKEKSNYDFVVTESNERHSFARRRELVSQHKRVLVKIDSIGSHSDGIHPKSRHITEIKEFKMQEAAAVDANAIDPYRAFFVLVSNHLF